MCPESSLDHFGQDKTIRNQTNQFFLRVPEKSLKIKNNPHMGVDPPPIQPYSPGLEPLTCIPAKGD